MKKKLIISLILMILMSMLVYSLVVVKYVSPADEFYLLRGSSTMGNLSFTANATPNGVGGNITNMSLYHNISGTWLLNYTNDTSSTVGAITTRIFKPNDISIISADLTDGLVFIWNVYACDNVSFFPEEDVSLQSDIFTVYDNYTNQTGINFSTATVVTAGRGRVTNFPLSSIDGVINTTGEVLVGYCAINGSAEGYFYCNQTRKTYNGSDGLLTTEDLISSSVKVNYTIDSTCRFNGANRTVFVEDAPSITLNLPTTDTVDAYGDNITVNFSVTSDTDTALCQVWANDTGTWAEKGGANLATNNTDKTTLKVFSEADGFVWNVRCAESTNSNIYGWGVTNFTLSVDRTDPAITSSAQSYSNYNISAVGYSAFVNLTVTDNNPNDCTLYINGSANHTLAYTSATAFAIYFNASDANYVWNLACSDDAGRNTTTANTSMGIDTNTTRLLRNVNYSSPIANCKEFTVDFNFSEEVN
ncbi:hypothetical protein LCGC14_0891790, partial [marine sediment metagenome]